MAILIECPWKVSNPGEYLLSHKAIEEIKKAIFGKDKERRIEFRHLRSGILEVLIADLDGTVKSRIHIQPGEWRVIGY